MKELTEKEFDLLSQYIKKNFGISLGVEKKSLIYSRLTNVLKEKNIKDFTEYYEYLLRDKSGEAVKVFIDKITTNHTFFMRETEHFNYLKEIVLPYIDKTYDRDKDVRMWCAGCSSGEESYTLQMILSEYFDNKAGWNTEMLATDISTTVLKKALVGIYTNESVDTLSENFRKKYFNIYDAKNKIVKDEIKNKIIYRKFNLMEDKFPFKKKFQVIFCRNVMIYFDSKTRDELVEKFYDLTESGGYLFIGHSESLNNTGSKYKYIKPAVYRKI